MALLLLLAEHMITIIVNSKSNLLFVNRVRDDQEARLSSRKDDRLLSSTKNYRDSSIDISILWLEEDLLLLVMESFFSSCYQLR